MTAVKDRFAVALSDRYRIERELGAGGMPTVYLAEDLKHKRKVAVKVLKPELAAVLGADRFVQEIDDRGTSVSSYPAAVRLPARRMGVSRQTQDFRRPTRQRSSTTPLRRNHALAGR